MLNGIFMPKLRDNFKYSILMSTLCSSLKKKKQFDEVESNAFIQTGSLKLFPDSKFLGGYREGQTSAGYQDSRLVFTVKPGVHFRNGSEIIINVDQGNFLKANCGIDENGNGNFTLAVQAQQLGRWYNKEGIAQVATAITNA